MSALQTESSEVFSPPPHLSGASGCHVVFYPLDDLLLSVEGAYGDKPKDTMV